MFIRASSLLIIGLVALGSCVAPTANPTPFEVSCLEQSFEILKIPGAHGDLHQHVLTLVPRYRFAQVRSAWHEQTIDIDFGVEVPGFQPVQLHREVGGSSSTLYVLGFDRDSGDGMMVEFQPVFRNNFAVDLIVVYQGKAMDFPVAIAMNDDFESTFFLLGSRGFIHRLDLQNGSYLEIANPVENPELLQCHNLICWSASDSETPNTYTLFATEEPLMIGCFPNYSSGIMVVLEKHIPPVTPTPTPAASWKIDKQQTWHSLNSNGESQNMNAGIALFPEPKQAVLNLWGGSGDASNHRIHFEEVIPGFQPTVLFTSWVDAKTAYVAGFDENTGDGILVHLVPMAAGAGALDFEVIYRGSDFSVPRAVYLPVESESEFYVLDSEGSIHYLSLEEGTSQTVVTAKDSPLLQRCHFLESAAIFDLEGNSFFAMKATESKPWHGCIPTFPLGANVTIVQRNAEDSFEVSSESDYKTNPFDNLIPNEELIKTLAESADRSNKPSPDLQPQDR